MNAYRAVIVTEHERQSTTDWALGTTADVICERWDAAGDRPLSAWCVTCNDWPDLVCGTDPSHEIKGAIVVLLPEDAS